MFPPAMQDQMRQSDYRSEERDGSNERQTIRRAWWRDSMTCKVLLLDKRQARSLASTYSRSSDHQGRCRRRASSLRSNRRNISSRQARLQTSRLHLSRRPWSCRIECVGSIGTRRARRKDRGLAWRCTTGTRPASSRQSFLVKKYEDTDYEPLAQLIRRIGNSREPFLVPQIGIPHGAVSNNGPTAWASTGSGPTTSAGPAAMPTTTNPASAGGVQPPFASSFPSFGTTLTADQQNALERRKQEEQYLMAQPEGAPRAGANGAAHAAAEQSAWSRAWRRTAQPP